MNYNILKLDLFSDWIEIVKSELTSIGYPIDTTLEDDELSILYFSHFIRKVSAKPRKIFKADIFDCPPEFVEGLAILEQKILDGQELKPHQSRQLKSLKQGDGLLYDWGIYHLHLGTQIESDGFIGRTGPLLYVRFDDTNAYFINILDHGAWTTQEFLRILHRNWPESIAASRIKDAIGVEHNFSDTDLSNLRNMQINTMIEIEEGVVYMGPGWGVSLSGYSNLAVDQHLSIVRGINDLEDKIRNNTRETLKEISPQSKHSDLRFKLVLLNGKVEIREERSSTQ